MAGTRLCSLARRHQTIDGAPRSGNLAINEKLPPMVSPVLRIGKSGRSLGCSSREMPSWVIPSSRARRT